LINAYDHYKFVKKFICRSAVNSSRNEAHFASIYHQVVSWRKWNVDGLRRKRWSLLVDDIFS